MASRTSRRKARMLVGRRSFAVGVLVLVGLLYYRPLHGYFSSRAQRAQRVSEVQRLKREKAAWRRKLREASTPAALAEQERLLGYVNPGEHLFLVKNIPQWRRHNAARHGPRESTSR